jgi:hypothetical protein
MSGKTRRLSLGWRILIAIVILIAIAQYFTQALVPK